MDKYTKIFFFKGVSKKLEIIKHRTCCRQAVLNTTLIAFPDWEPDLLRKAQLLLEQEDWFGAELTNSKSGLLRTVRIQILIPPIIIFRNSNHATS